MNRTLYFFIFLLTISCQDYEVKYLTYRDCKIDYISYDKGEKEIQDGYYTDVITNQQAFESARRRLALCLCEKYLKNPDNEIKAKIIEIYNSKEEYLIKEYPKNLDFDTILKERIKIFQFSKVNKQKSQFKVKKNSR